MDSAVRRALALFDHWNDVTGFVPSGSSYRFELEALISDAVHCGAQAATGDYRRLEDEPMAIFRAARSGR
jgi:hypothetical protein